MALQILQNEEIVEIVGKLAGSSLEYLHNFLEAIHNESDFLTLSLEKVTMLDHVSAKELEKLYKSAAKENKVLTIIGDQNANILPLMRKTKTDYILSHDRV
ncbi:hypothetical protein LVD13_13585 [Flavobacteriaceae bacterium D16]|nr:hypothetical protein [Flavobacteriaceae bacterium D16]